MEEYVGCKVVRKGNNKIHMFQPDIMHKLEKGFGIDVCEIWKYQTPAKTKFSVQRPTSSDVLIPAKMQKHFRIAVGLMLFLITFSCPDISNSVRELAKVNNGATQEKIKQIICAVKFVLDTRQKTLRFKTTENKNTTNYGTSMVTVIVTMLVRDMSQR